MRLVPIALIVGAACGRGGFDAVGGDARDVSGEAASPRWEELATSASSGGVTNHGTETRCLRLAADDAGVAYVAWADDSTGVPNVFLKAWDGSAWRSLAGSGEAGGLTNNIVTTPRSITTCPGDLKLDSQWRPYVVWHQYVSDVSQPIYLRYFDGAAWQALGLSDAAGGVSGGGNSWWPAFAFGGTARPTVAWGDSRNIYLRQWQAGSWQGLAGSTSSPGVGGTLRQDGIAVLAAGSGVELYVAWEDDSAGSQPLFVTRWTGAAWNELSAPPRTPGTQAWIGGLVSDSAGAPVLAWTEETATDSEIHVRRWDGSSWQAYGDASTLRDAGVATEPSYNPVIRLDPLDRPVIVWEATDTVGVNIHGARWDGTSWRSLDPEGSAGGISASAQSSTWPELAVDAHGTIYVAWGEEIGEGVVELYLRRSEVNFLGR